MTTPSKTPTRIYLVGRGEHVRLVRAAHPSHALQHVTRSECVVRVANQDELVKHVEAGVKVESVGDPDTANLFEAETA